ncbi:hypothetical protein DFH06DRAFT_283942 [Mycena polygramma]|nr:hypothetical protein DFH06DRAFT_283942 [Mycena polygramma]
MIFAEDGQDGSSTARRSRTLDRARIAAIDAEISNLRCAIRALRTEKELVEERLDTYRYPVLTLPNELISEIFVHFVPVYPSSPPLAGPLSPHTLTQICRRWREIALATPALWRAISSEEDKIHLVKACLHRSGRSLLSIQTREFYYTEPETLKVLVLHCARWEHVNLHFGFSQLSVLAELAMPFLRELEIRISEGGGSEPLPDFALPMPTESRMPLLRAATLWDFHYSSDLLPWFQLTSLTLIGKEPSECTQVLAHTTNLVFCELILYGSEPQSPDTLLPRLETLVLVDFHLEYSDSVGYLSNFVVPALRRLQVPDNSLAPDPTVTLQTFLAKSGCQLREVCITGKRAVSKTQYRSAFRDAIPTISFNTDLVDWYCPEADEIRKRGTRSMADFET